MWGQISTVESPLSKLPVDKGQSWRLVSACPIWTGGRANVKVTRANSAGAKGAGTALRGKSKNNDQDRQILECGVAESRHLITPDWHQCQAKV